MRRKKANQKTHPLERIDDWRSHPRTEELIAESVRKLITQTIDSCNLGQSDHFVDWCVARFANGQKSYGVGNWMRTGNYNGPVELTEELLDAVNIACMEEVLGRPVSAKSLICVCAMLLTGDVRGVAYIGISEPQWMRERIAEAVELGYIPIPSVLTLEDPEEFDRHDASAIATRVANAIALSTCVILDPEAKNPLSAVEAAAAAAQRKPVLPRVDFVPSPNELVQEEDGDAE